MRKLNKSGSEFIIRKNCVIFFILICLLFPLPVPGADKSEQESYKIHPDYEKMKPKVIAVLPMDNLSLEPDVETFLYNKVYDRLISKGYIRISVETVIEKMGKLGIQTPGQIVGISPQRLGKELKCDAVLIGQIDQSASVHGGVYDAIVVSCSLGLMNCSDGELLWRCEQWRAAHRQWQLDPFNALLNAMAHAKGSREDRIYWLVHEMLKTLPNGPVKVIKDDLFNRAVQIQTDSANE